MLADLLDVLGETGGAVYLYHESVPDNFDGTVIDIETTDDTKSRGWHPELSRQVILGVVGGGELNIIYVKDETGVAKLGAITSRILYSCCARPFYAYSCQFEHIVWKSQLGLDVQFDRELQPERYAKKKVVVQSLGMPAYTDPCHGDGFECLLAWDRGDTEAAIAHNRSCLLEERDILLRLGYRMPDYD